MNINHSSLALARPLVALALLAGVLGVACDGDDDEPSANGTSTPDETTVAVTLDEWSVEADPDTVPSGEVRFEAENAGTQAHELVIIRSDLAADALPVVDGVVPEDEVEVIGEIEEFPAGETDTGTFTLDAGSYILICNIETHYEQGMHTAFTVQ